MEPLSLWTAIALTVLVPTVLLAFVGLLFLTSLTRYNRPIVPQKGYSKDKEMSLVEESSTAHISGDFVVFIIGVAVHNWLDVRAWWPVFTGMKRMMDELQAHPECGYLGGHSYVSNPLVSVQYWRSMDSLTDYARAPSKEHFPVWVKMRSHMRQNKSFGIFHETFKVSAGQYETIYINMPPFGLSGVVGKTKLQGRHQTAKGRAGLTSGDDHPTDLPKRPF